SLDEHLCRRLRTQTVVGPADWDCPARRLRGGRESRSLLLRRVHLGAENPAPPRSLTEPLDVSPARIPRTDPPPPRLPSLGSAHRPWRRFAKGRGLSENDRLSRARSRELARLGVYLCD